MNESIIIDHPSTDGYLDYIQFGARMNDAAVNMRVHVFSEHMYEFLLGTCL